MGKVEVVVGEVFVRARVPAIKQQDRSFKTEVECFNLLIVTVVSISKLEFSPRNERQDDEKAQSEKHPHP